MTTYRPRMAATLTVPLLGTRAQRIRQEASTDSFSLAVRPKRISIERNDHNQADSCTLVADWYEVGLDARMLDNACVEIHIVNADENEQWTPSHDTCRFIGLTKEITSSRDSDNAAEVSIECIDYTTLFLEAKPFGSSGIPKYDQTLDAAWRTIVSQTPGAGILAGALVKEGFDKWPVLGDAVSERFKRLAYIPTEPDTDSWAVWQQCMRMTGLISYVKLDKVIVTTATNLYTESDSPILMWGSNIAEWSETRNSELAKTGVAVTSFDALTGTSLEAFWKPIGDKDTQHKRSTAKKILSSEKIEKREKRDWFTVSGVTEQAALDALAKRIYEERSHQELEGHISTAEMSVATQSGADFDLLSIAAGDSVQVIVDPQHRQLLSTEPDPVGYLIRQGYSEDAAHGIVSNMKEFARLESKFLVKSATIELASTEEGGSFSIEIGYCNSIKPDGSAVT